MGEEGRRVSVRETLEGTVLVALRMTGEQRNEVAGKSLQAFRGDFGSAGSLILA